MAGPENGSTSGASRSRASSADHRADFGEQGGFGRQAVDGPGEEAAVERQLHAVGSLGRRLNHDPAEQLAGGDAGSFAVGVVAVGRFDRQRDIAAEDQRILAERRRQPAQPVFPRGGVERVGGRRIDMYLRLLAREVGRRLVVLDLGRGVGAGARQRLGRLPVGAVGAAPQLEADRRFGVGQRQVDAGDARADVAVAAQRVRVVEGVVADADFDRRGTGLRLVAAQQRAVRCGEARRPRVVDGVADEVGGILGGLERVEVPPQLGLQDVDQRGLRLALNVRRLGRANKRGER